ncbi:helix-turn-helix domain-containing protein [Peribacillus sp. Hz7]|uniref:helix-turn-helix domain-containing protein n=1 Tax=Peribacillus sp. Hz7 TaxID=3344873 RepID=UPI0035CC1D31
MEIYNLHQTLNILKEYYITDSVQMVSRWIREGKIKATRSENRKDGWKIHHEDLFEFIEEQRPGLPEIMAVHEWYVDNAFRMDSEPSVKEIPGELRSQYELEKQQLEDQIMDMTNQLLSANQSICDLITEADKIKEGYGFLEELCEELYKQVEEMRKELIIQLPEEKQNVASLEKEQVFSITEKVNRKSSKKTFSYQDFRLLFQELSNECSSEVADSLRGNEEIPKEIYSIFFNETEQLEDSIIDGEEYRCPITNKPYKNLKSMLKNAIRAKLNEIVVKIKEEEEMETSHSS